MGLTRLIIASHLLSVKRLIGLLLFSINACIKLIYMILFEIQSAQEEKIIWKYNVWKHHEGIDATTGEQHNEEGNKYLIPLLHFSPDCAADQRRGRVLLLYNRQRVARG